MVDLPALFSTDYDCAWTEKDCLIVEAFVIGEFYGFEHSVSTSACAGSNPAACWSRIPSPARGRRETSFRWTRSLRRRRARCGPGPQVCSRLRRWGRRCRHAQSKRGAGAETDAFGHGFGNLRRHRAVLDDERRGHLGESGLERVGVDDRAAQERSRCAGHLGDALGDHAAGAAFGHRRVAGAGRGSKAQSAPAIRRSEE